MTVTEGASGITAFEWGLLVSRMDTKCSRAKGNERVEPMVSRENCRFNSRGVRAALLLLVAFLVAVVAPLHAVTAEGLKIAVVDTQAVLNKSIIGKAAKNNVETELKKGQARLAQLKSDFEKASAELSKQSAVLSGAALEERKEALGKKRTEYERAAMDLRDGVMRKNDTELGKAVKEIEAVVSEFASEEGYTFVFERDRQTVVYASEGIDITESVVQALDKKKVAL